MFLRPLLMALLYYLSPMNSKSAVLIKSGGSRLKRVLSFVKENHIVADIGCGHGILSAHLALQCSRVYAIDESALAAREAESRFNRIPLEYRTRVSLFIGSGLQPLLSQSISNCDCIILAGMGASTIRAVLEDQDALDKLNVKKIIIQPWPPNLLKVDSLFSSLLRRRWKFDDQSIDCTQGGFHLTSSFVLSCTKGNDDGNHLPTENSTLLSWPLVQSHFGGEQTDNVFQAYAALQKRSIAMKLLALQRNQVDITRSATRPAEDDTHGLEVISKIHDILTRIEL